MEQLNHETGEPLESSGNADRGVNLDQNSLGGVDEDLEATGFVDGRIKQSQKALRLVSRRS